jgi:3-hydroxyisobutyrate dehydrogenase
MRIELQINGGSTMSVDGKEPSSPGPQAGQRDASASPPEPSRIAFIGLGRMGSRLAWRMAEAGLPLAVYDADDVALDRFKATRIRRSRSPEAVVVDCPIVVTALPNGQVAREVLRAACPPPGTLVIDTSNGHPEETRALGATLAERGVDLVDAALSGGLDQAAAGRLLALIGGEPTHFARARPVLESFAEQVVHCGPLGSGLAMRALDGMLAAVNFAASIEALQIGRRYGLDLELMLDTFNRSAGANHATTAEIAPYVLTGRFNSGLALEQVLQEMTAALAVAQTTRTDVPLSRLAGELWRMAESNLERGADHTALARWYEHRSGTRLRS